MAGPTNLRCKFNVLCPLTTKVLPKAKLLQTLVPVLGGCLCLSVYLLSIIISYQIKFYCPNILQNSQHASTKALSLCVYNLTHPIKSIKALFPSPTPSCSPLELNLIYSALKCSASLLPPTISQTLSPHENAPYLWMLAFIGQFTSQHAYCHCLTSSRGQPVMFSGWMVPNEKGFYKKYLKHPRQHFESQQGIKDEQYSQLLIRGSFYEKKREIKKKKVPTLPTVLLM